MTEYITVTEYANIHLKDSGNIRRHLLKGNLPGKKIGKQWVIEKNTPYPKDKRSKHNKDLRNPKVDNLSNIPFVNEIKSMIDDFKKIYKSNLMEVILYGSYARGTQSHDSDVDLAIILSEPATIAEKDSMYDSIIKYELSSNIVYSVIDIDEFKFNKWKDYLPFYSNIHKEGITLWKIQN